MIKGFIALCKAKEPVVCQSSHELTISGIDRGEDQSEDWTRTRICEGSWGRCSFRARGEVEIPDDATAWKTE